MKNIYNRSEILKKAYSIKNTEGVTFGEAQKRAWKEAKAETVKGLLSDNIVVFQFEKDNGEVRTAKGTLNTNLYTYQSKGTQGAINTDIVKYWDLESNGFRCFKKCRFIKIIEVQAVQVLAMAA